MIRTPLLRWLLFTALLLAPVPALAAQPQLPGARDGEDGVRIVLMTMGPGDLVYERFGHNAIWVHDPEAGTDVAYNYGVFDFAQENFLTNFMRGRMMYWVDGWDAYATLHHYRSQDRDIWLQELDLTPEQAAALRDFLVWNARPENRAYRYDYYYDNCSTRVRDAIDRVLGGALRAATEAAPAGTTFRWHTARLTGERAADVPVFTGLMAGLGPASDRTISLWEEMFLPMKLRDALRALTIPGAGGAEVPLVRNEIVYHRSSRSPEPAAPPRWWPGYLLAGLAFGAALALLAHRTPASRAARFGYAALAGLWLAFAGTFGVVLLGLWALTDHSIAYGNHNLFHLSPLALPLLVLAPAMAYGARRGARVAWVLAAVVAALSVLGVVVALVPGPGQVNGMIAALAVPINLSLAGSLRILSARPPREPDTVNIPRRRPVRAAA
jgi:hypothetical protein